MRIPISPPFKYEDYDLSYIDLDMEGKFTTELQILCDKIYRSRITVSQMAMMATSWIDPEYRRIVASKITGLPEEIIRELPPGPYNKMITEVLAFFGEFLEDSTEQPPEEKPQITED